MMTDFLPHIELPVTDPTWIFFIVLCIILFAPIVFGKLNVPHIIGMILAGILIGEHGFDILDRDSSFELFGNVGLYYIMFLAGLEMNMENFKSIRVKAVVFGLLGFVIPMLLGYFANIWILGYAVAPSLLMAAMYASHTLVSYPIVTRYGVMRHRSVSIAVGATAITDSLTLFVLAIVGGQFKDGGQNPLSLLLLVGRVAVLAALIIYFFPRIGRWFFRKYSNGVVQFIFVLALVFLSAGLMKFVGMEGILGAFLAGLVLNRLIPHVSPLMHNLEFVGNALFVPYFLIGVGMLIDVKVFFGSLTALEVAAVMILASLAAKWVAAWVTQKVCRMASVERSMLFGLSTSRAAATLAVVLVGYGIILPDGSRLLGDEVLNGAIALILVTCIVSSFVTERASRRLALDENAVQDDEKEEDEKILISVSNPETVEHLVNLSLLIRDSKAADNIIALNVINDSVASPAKARAGKRILDNAVRLANSAGAVVRPISRYGLNVASGIIHTQKEQEATDVIIGLHRKSNLMDSFLGGLSETLLNEVHREIIIVKMLMPFNTIRRIVVAVPPKAEYEAGFSKWVRHIIKLGSTLGCHVYYHAVGQTAACLRRVLSGYSGSDKMDVVDMDSWDDLLLLSADVNYDHLLILVSARRGSISYTTAFDRLPSQISHYFANNSLMILYPDQFGEPTALQAFSDPMSAHVKSVSYASTFRRFLSKIFPGKH